MADRMRWIVVGNSAASRHHARAIEKDKGCERVIPAREPATLDQLAEALPNVGAVALHVPLAIRPAWVRAALEARRHVVVPVLASTDALVAADLARLAKQCGRVLLEAQADLYSPAAQTLAAHARGPGLQSVRIQRYGPLSADVQEMVAEALHRVTDLAGKAAEVRAVEHSPLHWKAEWLTSSGCVASVEALRAPDMPDRQLVEVESVGGKWVQEGGSLFHGRSPQTLLGAMPPWSEVHGRMARAIAENRVPIEDANRALQVAALLVAIAGGRTGPIAPA